MDRHVAMLLGRVSELRNNKCEQMPRVGSLQWSCLLGSFGGLAAAAPAPARPHADTCHNVNRASRFISLPTNQHFSIMIMDHAMERRKLRVQRVHLHRQTPDTCLHRICICISPALLGPMRNCCGSAGSVQACTAPSLGHLPTLWSVPMEKQKSRQAEKYVVKAQASKPGTRSHREKIRSSHHTRR